MPRLRIIPCLIAMAGCVATGTVRGDEARVDYLRDIKPVLKERCYACHGALKQNSGLRLDTASSLIRGGESGPAVIPGKSGASYLIEAVTGDLATWRMPPEGEPLTAQQLGLIRRWIDEGASLPEREEAEPDPREHWAFQKPVRPVVPMVRDVDWVRNPIDAFVAAEQERLGLQSVPDAERNVLLRRVYLDLIGLPPTVAERKAFLDGQASYETVVERLLSSPEYGQRWGRHWMDVWRYSDWSGENKNLVRGSPKHIWRWRDWIVDSLNLDKGYDRMIAEMLAGDEVAPGDPDVVRATGFLARNWYEFNRNVWLDDTVEHTAKAFLGLTLACARCHDHKFDPLSQREYYAWRAIFEPHDVRIDPVPGQPNTEVDGVPRVFDDRHETPTYLFIRGEETKPDKEQPLTPAVPAVLGQMAIQPVALPLTAYYPAVLPEARAELLRNSRAQLAAAQVALANVQAGSASGGAPAELAQRKLAAAEADLVSLESRIAAEEAKFADAMGLAPVEPARCEELAAAAAAADRLAALRRGELAAYQGEEKLAAARRAAESAKDEMKAKNSVSTAEKEMQAARRALAAAEAAMKRKDSKYTPLGHQSHPTSTGRRLALANWITDSANPLTARVAVNHVWLRHFGRPLVETVDDFGRRAPRPHQAALLDWLAVELVENGWSLKHLHRLIVTSHVYRLSSATRGAPATNAEIDRENRYLWRMNSRRAEAEVIRDSVLHVAGNLDRSLGGAEIPLNQAETSRRRSLYFRHAHERQNPFLEAFDGADALECYRRSVTIVPQQALALANSSLPYEQAAELAKKLTGADHGRAEDGFVRLAFEHVLTREPTAEETHRCLQFLADAKDQGRASLIHALMNHNDFITIR